MRYFPRCIALLLVLTVSVSTAEAAACQLKVGWNTWVPYIYQKDGRFYGTEYELLMTLSKAADCQFTFVNLPWARGLQMLQNNKLDMLFGASRTAEREPFAQFSRPYRIEEVVLVTPHIAGQADNVWLAQWLASPNQAGNSKVLGVMRGYYYNPLISPATPDPAIQQQLLHVGKYSQMIELLTLGRIDGYLAEAAIVAEQQKTSKQALQLLKVNEQPAEPMYLMFSRGVSPAIIQRIDAAILVHSGEISPQ